MRLPARLPAKLPIARPRASMRRCPDCDTPSRATSTQGPLTYRKCPNPDCQRRFKHENGNGNYSDRGESGSL